MKTPSPDSGTGPPLLVLVGPTAVGKTALAVRLAEAVGAEIISADSRQIYRGMDIGTAKPSPDERARVRHHLLDIVDPDQVLSVAEFQTLAGAAIRDILSRGCVPMLVGGTGQYVMAVVEGWQVPRVPPDSQLRRTLYSEAEEHGPEALHSRLRALDPVAADRIDPRNVRRVVRALEVCLSTGRPISEQQAKSPPAYRTLLLGLTLSRERLYARIDGRIRLMMERGLECEVRALLAAGYTFDLPALSGVGYAQFAPYIRGTTDLAGVVHEMQRASRRLARQQANWFRRNDPRIVWFEAEPDPYERVLDRVREFLKVRADAMS